MKLLLDTQVFLWWFSDPEKISKSTLNTLESPDNELFFSAASAFEIAIKVRLRKLKLPETPSVYIQRRLSIGRINPLPIMIDHAIKVSELKNIHEDPFDRLLISQAVCEGMHLVTSDKMILKYPIKTIAL